MAEDVEDAPEGEDEDGAAKRPGKQLVFLIGGGVLALLIIAVVALLFLGGGKDEVDHAEADHGDAHAEDHAHEDGHGDGHGEAADSADYFVYYELPDLLVNIRDADGAAAYLKLKLTLELRDSGLVEQIEQKLPRVVDRFQTFLRELRIEDINGSAGSYRLRQELLRRTNMALAPARIEAVLIEEMLVQ
ncbi:MAG: flagellar basal body-associated FliL family protein [Maricaulaceae bacterium]